MLNQNRSITPRGPMLACAVVFILASWGSPASAQTSITDLTCTEVGNGDVELSWNVIALIDALYVMRDGITIAVLSGADTFFTDVGVQTPVSYELVPEFAGVTGPSALCEISPLFFGGLDLTALGSATTTEETGGGGELLGIRTRALGDSGQDGIVLNAGLTDHVGVRLDEFDPSMFPVGGVIHLRGSGTDASGSPIDTSSIRLDSTGGGLLVSAAHAGQGSSTYTARVFNDGALVYEASGYPNDADCFLLGIRIKIGYKTATESCLILIETTNVSALSPTGGAPIDVTGDAIMIVPDAPTSPANTLDSMQVTSEQLSEFTLRAVEFELDGSIFSGEGDCRLIESNGVPVAAIEDSGAGDDGVATSIEGQSEIQLELETPFAAADQTLPEGGSVQMASVGAVPASGSAPLHGQITATKSQGQLVLSADYSGIGSPTYTMEIYNGTTLVYSESGLNGDGCATQGAIKILYKEYENGEIKESCFIKTTRSAVTTNGGATVMGDVVRMIPDLPANATSETARLTAGGGAAFAVAAVTSDLAAQQFVRGDVNSDGGTNLADAISLLSFLFSAVNPPQLACFDAADANDDGGLNIGDAVFLLNALFGGGQLPSPANSCGTDSTPSSLDCQQFPPCP